MIPLLVIAVWTLALALVAGLCAAARGGDVAQRPADALAADALASAGWESAREPVWGSTDPLVIPARARAGSHAARAAGSHAVVEPDASRARGRGVAA